MFHYSARNIAFVFWRVYSMRLGVGRVLAAMKSGGKASVVVPMTAVYPMVVCVIAPFILHEHITFMQGSGIACGLGAISLLAS